MSFTKAQISTKITEFFDNFEVEPYKGPGIPNINTPRLTFNRGLYKRLTFLYADIRGSADMADKHRMKTIANIYRLFHYFTVNGIKVDSGEVRSFDGDRVMGIFEKPQDAVNCALYLQAYYQVLADEFKKRLNNNSFEVGIGIASGDTIACKVGIRGDNNDKDVAWVGDAANLGAKLSDFAISPYGTYICEDTYNLVKDIQLNSESTYGDYFTQDSLVYRSKKIFVYKSKTKFKIRPD